MASYIGIEIGGTKLQIVCGDASARITHRVRLTVVQAEGGEGIRRQLQGALAHLLRETDPVSVGVGFGGPVDGKTGQVCCSHQIEGWSDFPLGEWLKNLTGRPVVVDNDANVAALGESLRGAGAGSNPVFYVTLGSGVGGGLVVDQKIYHGTRPGESEIGHIRLDQSGRIVESSCSGWAVDQKIRQAVARAPDSILAQLVGGVKTGEARFLLPALQKRDPWAEQILEETATDLGFALSHVVHLMHPEVIILGGGLSLMGKPFRQAVSRQLGRFVMQAFAPGPRIVLAQLAEDSVPVGALCLARNGLSQATFPPLRV